MASHKQAVNAATTKAANALRDLVDGPRSSERLRAAAEAIVALRQCFEHEGMPDWAGRSPDYRYHVEQAYRRADFPADGTSPLQANVRYHVGNVMREVAPPEHLNALGLKPKGPRGRIQEARAEGSSTRRRVAPSNVPAGLDPQVLVDHAHADLVALGGLIAAGSTVSTSLREALQDLMLLAAGLAGANGG